MRYITKVRIIRAALPVAAVVCSAFLGYDATHSLFAQTPPPTNITMVANQNVYAAGQDVTVYIKNASSKSIFILNKCPSEPLAVYRQERGAWVQIHAAADSAKCAGAPRDYGIAVGHAVPVDYGAWPSLFAQPGTYRIVAPIESYDGGPTVSFTVTH